VRRCTRRGIRRFHEVECEIVFRRHGDLHAGMVRGRRWRGCECRCERTLSERRRRGRNGSRFLRRGGRFRRRWFRELGWRGGCSGDLTVRKNLERRAAFRTAHPQPACGQAAFIELVRGGARETGDLDHFRVIPTWWARARVPGLGRARLAKSNAMIPIQQKPHLCLTPAARSS
jgi:hypothetical protein